ncbi:poly(U)-specific endoribonuclease homolog [Colletes gigas]|uniref:poly(U)-specific endoribonuclease homolog n=1 Tax=Colletes gigas TaxID=935657 RepID=UPI001C9B325E|nr:poly(U)-specific endoribonuclease homolog [Colletes gigas]
MLNKIIRITLCVLVIYIIIISYHSTTYQIRGPNIILNVSLTSDIELLNISEELFNKSSFEINKYLSIKYQGQITSKNFTDNAPERLLNILSNNILTTTTRSLIKLFDNYDLDTYQSEIITKEEEKEEHEFINDLMKTDAMLYVMHFLSVKGFFANNLQVHQNILKEIWFHPYSRSKGINGSSGFEHVFVGERKPCKGFMGLHNWISFFFGELSSKINYLGFSRKMEFAGGVAIVETYFTYNGKRKMSTMFIGTMPELEIALYTLCFFTRPNRKCKVSFTGFKFGIQTYTLRTNDIKFVATAFPVI